MYIIYPQRGIVVRISDGKTVSPISDTSDPDHIAWLDWCAAGNSPALGMEAQPGERIVSKLAFRRRMTLQERIAADNADDNVAIPVEARAALRTMEKDFEMAEEINLDDPDVIAGIQLLEQLGVIGAGRAAEILT